MSLGSQLLAGLNNNNPKPQLRRFFIANIDTTHFPALRKAHSMRGLLQDTINRFITLRHQQALASLMKQHSEAHNESLPCPPHIQRRDFQAFNWIVMITD